VRTAKKECIDGEGKYKDQNTKFELPSHVQLIARVFVDRKVANDHPFRTFNLAGACRSRVDWHDAGAGVNLFMPQARLLRADMRNAFLRGSYLQEVLAGVGFLKEIASAGEETGNMQTWEDIENLWDDGKTIYRANFEGANLSLTKAFRANFRGASFARANLEDADWREVKLQFANMKDANLLGIDLSGAE